MLIQGKYNLTRMIGQGTYATVYEATHVQKGTKVAIKFDRNENEVATKLIEHEISMYLELKKHKIENVVSIKSFGVFQNHHYMIMDYLPHTLEEYAANHRDKLNTLFQDALSLLRKLHEKHIVHRDIKPDNFLVSNKGKVYLIDLGMASVVCPKTPLKNIVGSMMYCSPYVHKLDPYVPRDDILSLCYVFFELYSNGVLPWTYVHIQNTSPKLEVFYLLKTHTDFVSYYNNPSIKHLVEIYQSYLNSSDCKSL